MDQQQLIKKYNYDAFTKEKVFPWLQFDASPALGQKAPDFQLWDLEGSQTQLAEIWQSHKLTVVEFGSFT